MNDDFELSRRKALAALGTIGAASAGAGLGTSAYFSDQETFENNQLTAGTLDMKVDWEEHYSDWSDDEDDPADSAEPELDIRMDEPADPADYTAFPPGVEAFDGENDDDFVNGDPLLYVHNDDVGQFMDNTSIEAFPDEDDDGVQDDFDQTAACEELTDVGNDDPGLGSDMRTADSVGDPLIDLADVKPGDFGELTLSFHLCDNPGYVWLNADNLEARENGLTEPEADDPDEEGPADEESTEVQNDVELLDEIQTAWWYDDNCDNLTDGSTATTGDADVVLVLDRSGSMTFEPGKFDSAKTGAKTLVDALGSGTQVGLVSFASSATLDQGLTTDKQAVKDAIDDLTSGGGTDIEEAVDAGRSELTGTQVGEASITPSGDNRDQNRIMVFLTNGSDTGTGITDSTDEAKDNEATTIYTIAYGSNANEALLEDMASPPKDDDGVIEETDEFAYIGGQADIDAIFDDIGGQISTGEEVFFQGSLRAAMGALTDGNGIPLDGDPGDFDEIGGDDDDDARDCFAGVGSTHCIGFSWWLPVDHANEIQSDSVSFDLGFYTEQCRHNDGSGMNNEAVSNDDEVDA
ncbi:VWA domain-containing protein [Haloplanus rallus]|uniref:VWA domain-containing protein n=1 Tax=Haloplanus rallus TaxID=1816183 RepID=A0A6B9FH09_9EURY|nr:vWA domain-containing protein [Haloplanus rallus]QGX95743.1 VWA domain-containing protein [Haloplanus rallus]